MSEYQVEHVAAALLKIADVMKNGKDLLTEIDSKNGDGDLGVSMEKGATAIGQTVESLDEGSSISALLTKCGSAFNKAAPSTLGTLIGMSLMFLGKSWSQKDCITEADIVQAPVLVKETIERMGKAKAGDKTVLDALEPFAAALSDVYRSTGSLSAAWNQAADAAKEGAEATRGMVAKMGRARWLGERASGNIDGGALLCSMIVDAFRTK